MDILHVTDSDMGLLHVSGAEEMASVTPPKKKHPLRTVICLLIALAILFALLYPAYEAFSGKTYTGEFTEWIPKLPQGISFLNADIEKCTLYREREMQIMEGDSAAAPEGWTLLEVKKGAEAGDWSPWSTEPVAASDGIATETRTVCRSRALEKKDSQTPNLSGWTLIDTSYRWGDFGFWSDWSTSPAYASDSRKVDTKTQYSSRTKSFSTQHGSWGPWSPWQSSYVSASDTCDVETRTVPATYKTQYNYSRYTSKPDGHGWNGPLAGTWSGYNCQYYQEYGWVDSPLPYYGSEGSFSKYGEKGTWYNQVTRSVQVSSSYTQYRYRTRSVSTVTNYTDWTPYGDSYVSGSNNVEVRTRTMYRYCDRERIPTYHYERWGAWTNWTEAPLSESASLQVETRQEYRWRTSGSGDTYIYYRWGNWSDWTEAYIAETDSNEVEQNTFYRYRTL